jgi:hypothetical protein
MSLMMFSLLMSATLTLVPVVLFRRRDGDDFSSA